jgi:hypothetical protein
MLKCQRVDKGFKASIGNGLKCRSISKMLLGLNNDAECPSTKPCACAIDSRCTHNVEAQLSTEVYDPNTKASQVTHRRRTLTDETKSKRLNRAVAVIGIGLLLLSVVVVGVMLTISPKINEMGKSPDTKSRSI